MSSHCELYISEEISEKVSTKLTKIFGYDWVLDSSDWMFDNDINRIMYIDICTNTGKKIGSIIFENAPDVVGDLLGNDVLGWSPKKLLQVKKGGKIIYQVKNIKTRI